MKNNLFTSLSVLAILCLQDVVNAEYCPDNVTAGKCFKERIVPFVIGGTTVGFIFGFFLVILSLCLFCKTKVKNGAIDWVHDREPTNWVRDVQNLGMVNNGHQFEQRKRGLGDNKPQTTMPRHFVSDRSLYSERATTSAFPSSNASEIMGAMDEIHDQESRARSGYYWAPGGAPGDAPGRTPGGAPGDAPGRTPGGAPGDAPGRTSGGAPALPEKERGSEYETVTSSRNVHSAQILHHKKFGKAEDPSSDGSTIVN